MFHEALGFSPVSHCDEDGGECQDLSDFHTDVEGDEVDEESIRGDFVFEDFGCEPETVEESEDEGGGFG